MQHSFDVDIAVKYGIVEAVLLNHFQFWIEHNAANETNFYDGRYWTFNSMKALGIIFPYLSGKKIRNALKHLQDEGLLLVGNYNKSTYDRTLWYALSDLAVSILPKGQMDFSKRANGNIQKGKPIPDKYTDNITDICMGGADKTAPPRQPEEPAIMHLILNDKSQYPITQSDVDLWKSLYPAVDIMAELRKMAGWLDANSARRKTKAGIKRFVNSWLSREQDKGAKKPKADEGVHWLE